jgi:hypothetical protein
MTFGCGLKVPQSVAKQGLKSLVANSTVRGTGTLDLPSKVNFYISFCRLHHIIGEVFETFYISNDLKSVSHSSSGGAKLKSNPSTSFDQFSSLFRIESDLNDWAGSLHPFFQMPSDLQDPTPTKHITREANVLRARFVPRYSRMSNIS